MSNKWGARRAYSTLCRCTFASEGEKTRGEELRFLELAGEITDLKYHQKFRLSKKPSITIEVDFVYKENGETIYEDFKGKECRDYRVKRIWLKEQQGIEIKLVK